MEVCSKMSNMFAGGARDEFKETELRLGLPGGGCGGGDGEIAKNSGKRGFSETIDLKLELTSKDSETKTSPEMTENPAEAKSILPATNDPARPPASKAQVVGWPPVRSFRKNILAVQKSNTSTGTDQEEKKMNNVNNTNNNTTSTGGLAFVKVSMDGAPYLRKVDLKMHKSYQELSAALGKMFSSFTIGNCGSEGMLDFMNESKLMDLLNGSEYLPTYEDKDGDWMLVGDVPWEMFVDSCKRLRIMKGSDAIGLAPRAVEKCRNRS